MLICRNCFTENADGTIKCIQCNMEGNFEKKVTDGDKREFLLVKHNAVQCTNCGSETPGEGSKCFHCNFPLPSTLESIAAKEIRNLKTG